MANRIVFCVPEVIRSVWFRVLYVNSVVKIIERALIPMFKSVKCVHDRPPAVTHLATLSHNNQYL